jgi:hypothetical protein
MANNRELSQFASFVEVGISSIGITTSVGIGKTNPQFDLDVAGDINFTGTFYQGGTQFIASRWSATGSDIYRLSKVGINTSIVSSTLTVNGDVYVSGVVTATSFIGAVTGTATSTTNIPNLTGAITSNNTTTSLGSFTSANLSAALIDETGSGSAVFATSPTLVTPVLGAATATSIVVSSGSTFTNGPVLVGAATSTGTASQPLQVTGGAYVSGSVGIGTNNPTSKLQVVGDTRVSGVVTAFDFYNTAEYPNIRPTLDLAFSQTKILDSRITFTRASTATYVNSVGILTTAAVNEARFDHDPYTGESLGLLVEEARTNLFTQSIDSNHSSTNGASVSNNDPNIIAPNGTTTAVGYTPTSPSSVSEHSISWESGAHTATINHNTNYIFSYFVKPDPNTVAMDMGARVTNHFSPHQLYFQTTLGRVAGRVYDRNSTTESTSAFAIPYPNNWWRVYAQVSLAGGSTYSFFSGVYLLFSNGGGQWTVTDSSIGRLWMWGWQLEQGTFPTSYIPTSGSTVTRAADVASITGTNFSSWYRQSGGTVFIDLIAVPGTRSQSNTSTFGISPVGGPWSGNLIGQNTDSNGIWYTYDTGILELVQTINLNPSGNKFAWGLTAGASSVGVKDGVTLGNYSWSDITRSSLIIGSDSAGAIRWRRLTYYPVRLPDAQLQTLTL